MTAAANQLLEEAPTGQSPGFGNVSSHHAGYGPAIVLDLHEPAAGITDLDIITFVDAQGFVSRVSLTTLETVA